jgi:hypothetical protein
MSKSPRSNPLMASRLNLINKIIRALGKMENPSSPLLLVFWGSRGSGKTTFLEEAKRRLSSEPDMAIAGLWDLSKSKFQELPEKILKTIRNKKSKYKAVFIDNMDILLKDPSGKDFFDFENKAILPLIEQGDTLILMGSQVELSLWQEYDVRLRQENYHLGSLSLDEIKEMVKGTKFDAETVYKLTFGQPKALEEYLSHPKWDEQDTARFASNYFLEELPKETRNIAQMVSLFPAFNVYILRKAQGDENKEDDGLLALYNEQINELTRRWIVQFDTDSGAYRFTDNAIRRLLALHYALSRPKQFKQIQHIAAEYFQEEAKSASFLPQIIVSAIYHQAQASRAQSEGKRGAHCVKWVESMRDYWNGANWKQVIEKWESGDGNKELKNEIISLIGTRHHQKISEIFSQYKKEMEA